MSTAIVIVAYASNLEFFNDIQTINNSKELFSILSILQFEFRTYLNIGNNLEYQGSEIIKDKYEYLR